ncbi:GTPase LSG1-1 [Chlorella vulgaris]
MGKHNGKARKAGLVVGSALVNRAKKDGRTGSAAAYLHATDTVVETNMQSVIEANDLDEMMAMASLAGKDFTAEREHIIVISTGAVAAVDVQRMAAERAEAEDRNRHRLCIPRRPSWDESTTPEQLEEQERSHFLHWRRELASLEQDERLVLTPFEKNLEVWRQLWRVLERSDVVVQVVDARDPLTYRSEDLERYARALHPTKRSLLLLNKADLLPEALRSAWADHFDSLGLDYVFWSAKSGMDEQSTDEDARAAAAARQKLGKDPRARVLGVDDLLSLLERRARQSAAEAEAQGMDRASRGEHLVVGLTGYPNVGKSSTINALFGSKKTAVAPTPGKTKHFQTLNVTATLCLCDCPGLVLPQYAHSKAEMVAAGMQVLFPLTVSPMYVHLWRRWPVAWDGVSLKVFTACASRPRDGRRNQPGKQKHLPPTAVELLRAFAYARGWVASSGLPDETRAGRRILKDYVDGKTLYCKAPPGASQAVLDMAAAAGQPETAVAAGRPVDNAVAPPEQHKQQQGGPLGPSRYMPEGAAPAAEHTAELAGAAAASGQGATSTSEEGATSSGLGLDEGDLLMMEDLGIGSKKVRPVRPSYKFHKKQMRSKGDRGEKKDVPGVSYDGASLVQGKRGGIVQQVE